MTALTITKANVALVSGTPQGDQIAGEAFDAGDMVYFRTTDSKWLKAQGDGTAAEAGAGGIGMALATADAAGARVTIARAGCIVSIGTGTAGVVYVLGDTAGDLMPVADAGSTDKVTVAAIGIGSNQIKLAEVYHSGSALA